MWLLPRWHLPHAIFRAPCAALSSTQQYSAVLAPVVVVPMGALRLLSLRQCRSTTALESPLPPPLLLLSFPLPYRRRCLPLHPGQLLRPIPETDSHLQVPNICERAFKPRMPRTGLNIRAKADRDCGSTFFPPAGMYGTSHRMPPPPIDAAPPPLPTPPASAHGVIGAERAD